MKLLLIIIWLTFGGLLFTAEEITIETGVLSIFFGIILFIVSVHILNNKYDF